MKKGNIIFIILLILLIAASIFAYANRAYINIIHKGFTMTLEDIDLERQKTDEKAKEVVKEYGIDNVRTLTEEESQKLKSGELTEEEAIDLILGTAGSETPGANSAPSNSTAPAENTSPSSASGAPSSAPAPNSETQNPQPSNASSNSLPEPQDSSKEKVSRLIGKMYVLKSQFTGEIAAIEAEAKEEYKSLPKEERKSQSAKLRIGAEALDKATGLERRCDAEVEQVLNELTSVLNETNQSTKLVDEIRSSYEREKELTKSYYISKFQK